METRTILHCDLNNYFASVEMLRHPEYREVPMIVGGDTEQRHGIVLAKNELAKKYGIKTGETIYQARAKCPVLVITQPCYEEYSYYSRTVKGIYSRYTDQVEPFGSDECWLDVTASTDLFGSGWEIAQALRQKVKDECGLTISVGVSFNKVFAKLGSDIKKPDAVTEIPKEKFREIVWPLPAYEMLGVGMKTYKKIYERGCRTIGDIANMEPKYLESWLGKAGGMLWRYANGMDTSRVLWRDEEEVIKSIGHGTTTAEDLQNSEQVRYVLEELSEEVARRLRENRLSAGGVSVQVRENDMVVREYQCQLPQSTQLSRELAREAAVLFCRKHIWRRPIRSVTLRAIGIQGENVLEQLSMFTNLQKRERLLELEDTKDRIRQRYGAHAVVNCSYLSVSNLSTARIGYGAQI